MDEGVELGVKRSTNVIARPASHRKCSHRGAGFGGGGFGGSVGGPDLAGLDMGRSPIWTVATILPFPDTQLHRVAGTMADERLSFCRICAAACGIVVTVDGEQIVQVRGDPDHAVSRGYTCPKARGLPEWHHARSRLDRPTILGREVAWEEALDDLAAVLGGIVAGPGPDAVGLYLATGLAYDAGGQVAAGMWMASIGTRSFFTAATVDNAPVLVAAELVAGNAMLNPVWDPTTPGLLVLVGTNPVVSHGYGTTLPDPIRYLRAFRGRGGRIWVIDPRRSESAMLADGHIQTRPGADVAVLAAAAAELLARGADRTELAEFCDPEDVRALAGALAPFTIDRAARAAGVDAAHVELLIEDIRRHPGRVAIQCGTGTTMSSDGVVVEWLRWVLLILSGSLDRPGGMRFYQPALGRLRPPRPSTSSPRSDLGPASRPDLPRVARQLPAVALADEIEAGNLRALVVTGGNPLAAIPEPARTRAALEQLEALVVIDVMDSELCRLASHVLPATGQLERADITTSAHMSVGARLQATGAVVAPRADRRPVWWILGMLSRRMGGDLFGGADPDAMTDEVLLTGLLGDAGPDVFTAGPRGVALPADVGWVRSTMLPGGRWRIAPPEMIARLANWADPDPGLVMTPRREMAWSNSVRYAGSGEQAVVRVHPVEAEAAGLREGGTALLTSSYGTVKAVVATDDGVRPGVVSFTHGHTGADPGAVTSARHEVDPLTTMPHASGLAVTLAPAE